MIDPTRITKIKDGKETGTTVVYWMNRDQRAHDNWALLHACEVAKEKQANLAVVFNYAKDSIRLTRRHFDFMLQGLKDVQKELQAHGIPFHVISGEPSNVMVKYLEAIDCAHLVTDFSPLKAHRRWLKEVCGHLECGVDLVDAHNIVPYNVVSDKEEYAARTIRSKINKRLEDYLTDFPDLEKYNCVSFVNPDRVPFQFENLHVAWETLESVYVLDENVKAVEWLRAGQSGAVETLRKFIDERLENYNDLRNDPNEDAQSDLSPYFHFGQVAPQRVAYEIRHIAEPSDNTASFLEEMIVRRELTDNYCYYNENYDRLEGVKDWAKLTLHVHRNDQRDAVYDLEMFENAKTHDDLWNAAQMELIKYGKMHGYMRMYWAKKILEWTRTPEEAFNIALELNDKYSLDGSDPNGYVGVAWSIGGVHDRAWKERPVYGKIRYMNKNGCKRKFDVHKYVQTILGG